MTNEIIQCDISAVFFDLGDTLGSVRVEGEPPRLIFNVFPFVFALLARLKDAGLRLGVISNTGEEKSRRHERGARECRPAALV